MSWVSQTNLKTIMTAIRNKFTTGDLVIANDDKSVGVEVNHTAQDGLVTVSPISTDASVESALHLSNGDDTKKTELTQGTLSYVTGTGDNEEYNYMSLLGDGVTFGKKGGGNVQLGGVADPTSNQQVATKAYSDSITKKLSFFSESVNINKAVISSISGTFPVYRVSLSMPSGTTNFTKIKQQLTNPLAVSCACGIANSNSVYNDTLLIESYTTSSSSIFINGTIIALTEYNKDSVIHSIEFRGAKDNYSYK